METQSYVVDIRYTTRLLFLAKRTQSRSKRKTNVDQSRRMTARSPTSSPLGLVLTGSAPLDRHASIRRRGRVAEGGGLLNRYTLQRRIEGSNPSVSAKPSMKSIAPRRRGVTVYATNNGAQAGA